MDILVIGSGGREAAIIWKLAQSARVDRLYCAPGNHGISRYASCFPVAANDIEGILDLAKRLAVDLVFVAPDDPLAMGLVDRLEDIGIDAFGPKQRAAQLESSKSFAKNLMKQMRIPTAECVVFSDLEAAIDYAETCELPQVLKADGLALGKGVVICHNRVEILQTVHDMMREKRYGEAGQTILFEEFLVGPELTLLAFTDGKSYSLMPTSRDHKRALDGDLGPNTGGMGAVVPGAELSAYELSRIESEIIQPTLDGLRLQGIDYKGIIYFGLMLTADGPKVIEYNARFGDPECQALLPLLETDLVQIIQAINAERLGGLDINWRKDSSCALVLASGGYPGDYTKGYPIRGLKQLKDVYLFEAGTIENEEQQAVTNGGRVLTLVSTAVDLNEAISVCYREAEKISFTGLYYRKDIGTVRT